MYAPAIPLLKPEHLNGELRLFVIDGAERSRLIQLGMRVLEVYSQVTWRQLSEADLRDYPSIMFSRLAESHYFDIALGMPRLKTGAGQRSGKITGRQMGLVLNDSPDFKRLSSVRFSAYTNDYMNWDDRHPESVKVYDEFEERMRQLADTEFAEISVPFSRSRQGGVDSLILSSNNS